MQFVVTVIPNALLNMNACGMNDGKIRLHVISDRLKLKRLHGLFSVMRSN